MEYIKINSLWKRQEWYFDEGKKKSPHYQKGRQSFIEGDYAHPEFGNIVKWRIDEKVDGTNVRIIYQNGNVRFGGRTANSQLPPMLLSNLKEHFTDTKLHHVFHGEEGVPFPNIILFGEGYGDKIQAPGGNYRKDQSFILFDAIINEWWLDREKVQALATQLNVPHVPDLGIMTEKEIVEFVKSKPQSQCSETPQSMEGIVARSEPLMLFRNKTPIIWKLKCKEFL